MWNWPDKGYCQKAKAGREIFFFAYAAERVLVKHEPINNSLPLHPGFEEGFLLIKQLLLSYQDGKQCHTL